MAILWSCNDQNGVVLIEIHPNRPVELKSDPESQSCVISLFFWLFQDKVSLCSTDWPRIQSSACPCLWRAGIKSMSHHGLLLILIIMPERQQAFNINGMELDPPQLKVASEMVLSLIFFKVRALKSMGNRSEIGQMGCTRLKHLRSHALIRSPELEECLSLLRKTWVSSLEPAG